MSLFAFVRELCRDGDVTPDATRTDECRATGAASTSATAISGQAGAKASAENFPVALRFLPRRYRGHLAAVYGFARSADDMGDEAAAGERLDLLDELEADLGRLYRMISWADVPDVPGGEGSVDGGIPSGGDPGSRNAGGSSCGHPGAVDPGGSPPRLAAVRALAPAVVACAIPAQPFHDPRVTGNPRIELRVCTHGGHCGFVGARSALDDGYWAETQIVEFISGRSRM